MAPSSRSNRYSAGPLKILPTSSDEHLCKEFVRVECDECVTKPLLFQIVSLLAVSADVIVTPTAERDGGPVVLVAGAKADVVDVTWVSSPAPGTAHHLYLKQMIQLLLRRLFSRHALPVS